MTFKKPWNISWSDELLKTNTLRTTFNSFLIYNNRGKFSTVIKISSSKLSPMKTFGTLRRRFLIKNQCWKLRSEQYEMGFLFREHLKTNFVKIKTFFTFSKFPEQRPWKEVSGNLIKFYWFSLGIKIQIRAQGWSDEKIFTTNISRRNKLSTQSSEWRQKSTTKIPHTRSVSQCYKNMIIE